MTSYLVIHGALLGAAIIFIIREIRRTGNSALLAAVWGATFMLSSLFMFIYATGKVPPGFTDFAELVNENRAK